MNQYDVLNKKTGAQFGPFITDSLDQVFPGVNKNGSTDPNNWTGFPNVWGAPGDYTITTSVYVAPPPPDVPSPGDLVFANPDKGIIVTSTDGTKWRIGATDSGMLFTEKVV